MSLRSPLLVVDEICRLLKQRLRHQSSNDVSQLGASRRSFCAGSGAYKRRGRAEEKQTTRVRGGQTQTKTKTKKKLKELISHWLVTYVVDVT